jgi:hypothetical protein
LSLSASDVMFDTSGSERGMTWGVVWAGVLAWWRRRMRGRTGRRPRRPSLCSASAKRGSFAVMVIGLAVAEPKHAAAPHEAVTTGSRLQERHRRRYEAVMPAPVRGRRDVTQPAWRAGMPRSSASVPANDMAAHASVTRGTPTVCEGTEMRGSWTEIRLVCASARRSKAGSGGLAAAAAGNHWLIRGADVEHGVAGATAGGRRDDP